MSMAALASHVSANVHLALVPAASGNALAWSVNANLKAAGAITELYVLVCPCLSVPPYSGPGN